MLDSVCQHLSYTGRAQNWFQHPRSGLTTAEQRGRITSNSYAAVELLKVPTSPFLQLLQVPLDSGMTLWWISHASWFCTICKLIEGTLSRSKSLTKMLNRTESSTDPSGTPIIVTGLQLDFVPLDTTLWTNSLSRFSTHITICSSSPYLSRFSVSILLNSTMKVFLKSRQTISSLSPHLSSQSFNCRSLSCCLSISYSLQIHAGSQLPVCPWKQVPELFVPLPSQWSRWDWYISVGLLSLFEKSSYLRVMTFILLITFHAQWYCCKAWDSYMLKFTQGTKKLGMSLKCLQNFKTLLNSL